MRLDDQDDRRSLTPSMSRKSVSDHVTTRYQSALASPIDGRPLRINTPHHVNFARSREYAEDRYTTTNQLNSQSILRDAAERSSSILRGEESETAIKVGRVGNRKNQGTFVFSEIAEDVEYRSRSLTPF